MSDSEQWELPAELQPQAAACAFDLDAAYASVVMLRSEVPDDAFTAGILGTERIGSGVVIATPTEPLVLTIGYLVTEAESIWLSDLHGHVVAACPLAVDAHSGLALVQPLQPLRAAPLARASAQRLSLGDPAVVIGHGGAAHSLQTKLVARRAFAGYWEYLLEEALFTSPAHPQWGGTALLDLSGQLVGIGSLFVQESETDERYDANMFVPVDLLEPVLDDMVRLGAPQRPARPWLGLYAAEQGDQLTVMGVAPDGPAARAGLKSGDIVLQVNGQEVLALAPFLRSIWALGSAGVEVALTIERDGERQTHTLVSAAREQFLKQPRRH